MLILITLKQACNIGIKINSPLKKIRFELDFMRISLYKIEKLSKLKKDYYGKGGLKYGNSHNPTNSYHCTENSGLWSALRS